MNITNIIESFSVEALTAFLRNKIHSFKPETDEFDYLFEENEEILNNYSEIQKIGEAEFSDSEDILIITAKTENELTSRSGKKKQYEIAKKILKEEVKDSAFFIFYDKEGNFRFSFIRVEYEGTKKEYSTFKRYTYFVSPKQTNKTFITQLNSCNFDSIDSIQQAFSVEPLTKDFYLKLQSWYFWAIHQVTFPSEPTSEEFGISDQNKYQVVLLEHKAQNVIRLLTRFLFVWFIKQKKLIPDELFDLKILQENILKNITPYHDENGFFAEESKDSIYYKAILQNLFFATLNCPIEAETSDKRERSFRLDNTAKAKSSRKSDYGVTFLMRYKEFFRNPKAFLEMVNKTVPFLNGGLFECLDIRGEGEKKEDRVWIDGFSENLPKEHKLIVPDYLFFGRNEKVDLSNDLGVKNKKTKEIVVNGLINLLESYNFTIDENEPNDVEVALDPELLGKVFENLLASYNPETKTTARKQTGSFYTPREIVSYMVDESLIAHLKNSVKWDGYSEEELDKKLHNLISYSSDNPFLGQEKVIIEIIHALDSCKILDPACGSGAFPMGILQKMVHILQKLDPDNKHWHEIQYQKALNETQGAFKIRDKKEREEFLLSINEAFDENMNQPDYARKLFLIENCIYGVDIQPIASQISKLRFFISLVVEQNVINEKQNFGIRPLPNLETKFVTANTLIGIEKDGELFQTDEVKAKEQELKEIRHKLFSAKTKETKLKYRKKDKELRNEIAEILEEKGLPTESAQKLASWDPYDQNGCSSFFDPEWMYDIKDGFDIVIGNPPYFNINNLPKHLVKYLSTQYDTIHTGYNDIVYYFIYLSIKMLGKTGCSVLITSNYFMGNEYAQKLRLYLNKHISKIVNFKEHMVFDAASVHTCISISYNAPNNNEVLYFETDSDKRIASSYIEQELNSFLIKRHKLNDNWIIADRKSIAIIKDLKNKSILLGDISTIEKGPTSGKNTVFTISCDLANEMNLEKAILRKNVKNGDIDMYTISNRGNLLIYVDNDTLIESFPKVFSYLKKHKEILANRNEVKKGLYPWYRLERPRKKLIFDAKEKILVPYRAKNNRFAYDNQQYFNDGGDIRAIVIDDDGFNLKYILAILNSKLINWYYGFIGKPKGKNREYFNKPLSLIPIKESSVLEQKYLIILTDIVISDINSINRIHLLYERIIDALVFELYFTDHMKKRNIDVLQFVEKDLNEVMQNRDFEALTDSEKEKNINELNSRWSDPENEIVKRMNSFKEKSPDILKVILES